MSSPLNKIVPAPGDMLELQGACKIYVGMILSNIDSQITVIWKIQGRLVFRTFNFNPQGS